MVNIGASHVGIDQQSERLEWLLLFLSRGPLGITGEGLLDPIRIQKGLFLLSKRGPKSARDLYHFQSYYWGPFSSTIYGDLAKLAEQGLVESIRGAGQAWPLFRATTLGEQQAAAFAGTLDARAIAWVAEDRGFLSSRSFTKLLQDIYAAYPEYADKSLLRK